jgi:hypothetical protein
MASVPQGLRRSLAAATVLAVLSAGAVRAAEIETRAFRVYVDGKPGGTAKMIIHNMEDSTVSIQCDTDITVTVVGLIKAYSYSYHGHETWKGSRLLRLHSNTNDNGKRFQVSAVADRKSIRVTANGQERLARPDLWVTSYWRLPEPGQRGGGEIALLDADTGKDLSGRLEYIGTEKRKIADQEVDVNHYRLTGKIVIELWYDGSERLVRQEWVEDGHRANMELYQIERK